MNVHTDARRIMRSYPSFAGHVDGVFAISALYGVALIRVTLSNPSKKFTSNT